MNSIFNKKQVSMTRAAFMVDAAASAMNDPRIQSCKHLSRRNSIPWLKSKHKHFISEIKFYSSRLNWEKSIIGILTRFF